MQNYSNNGGGGGNWNNNNNDEGGGGGSNNTSSGAGGGLPEGPSVENFSEAVQISMVNAHNFNLETRRGADQYLMALTVSAGGLNLALHILQNEGFDEFRVMWALNTLQYHIPEGSIAQINMNPGRLYDILHGWIKHAFESSVGSNIPAFLYNKHAQLMVFGAQAYWLDGRWPTVFSDLIHLSQTIVNCNKNSSAAGSAEAAAHASAIALPVLTYSMRVFECIEERVVNPGFSRNNEQRQRDADIKDLMRSDVLNDLVPLWYSILCDFHHRSADLTELSLDVIKHYIDWADISLFLNPDWMNLLYFLMTNTQLRCNVCQCLSSLVDKGERTAEFKFETMMKMRLHESIPPMVDAVIQFEIKENGGNTKDSSALYPPSTGEPAGDMMIREGGQGYQTYHSTETMSESERYLMHVCSLVVNAAQNACNVAADSDGAADPLKLVHIIVPNVVRLFDLQLYVTKETILSWLTVYIKSGLATPEEEEQIIGAVLRQSLLPSREEFAFADVVNDQRKIILNVTRILNMRNPKLVQGHCLNVIQSMCEEGDSVVNTPFQHLEAALRYVYELGENCPGGLANHLKDSDNNFSVIISGMVRSSIIDHPSSMVHLAYFEVMERYSVFFSHWKDFVPALLSQLLSSRAGVCNPNPRVRNRICGIFIRLATGLKAQFQQHLPTIVNLLVVILGHADDTQVNLGGVTVPNNASDLTASDRNLLYEGLGTLLGGNDLTSCAMIVQQIISAIEQFCSSTTNDGDGVAYMVADHISYLSSLSKGLGTVEASRIPDSPSLGPQKGGGFKSAPTAGGNNSNNNNTGNFPAVSYSSPADGGGGGSGSSNSGHTGGGIKVFFSVTEGVLATLNSFGGYSIVREKVTLFMQQMVNILGAESLGFMVHFVVNMLVNTTIQELPKVLRLTSQVATKTRSRCIDTMSEVLPHCVRKVSEVAEDLAQVGKVHGVVAESTKEQLEVFKYYFQLLHAMSQNSTIACLEKQSCQAVLPLILSNLLSALRISQELEPVPKSLQIVTNLTNAWANQEPDMAKWLVEQYIPVVFEAASYWNLSDGKIISLCSEVSHLLIAVAQALDDKGLYSVFAIITAPQPLNLSHDDAHNFLSGVKGCCQDANGWKKVRVPLVDLLRSVQQNRSQSGGGN